MDKQWIEEQKSRIVSEAETKRAELTDKINHAECLTDQDKQEVIGLLNTWSWNGYNLGMFGVHAILKISKNHSKNDERFHDTYFDIKEFLENLDVDSYISMTHKTGSGLDRYLDSEPMEFDGDIIITDPCYIIRAEHHGTKPITDDDWHTCGYGDNMEALGITHYMTRDTIYGDWGCTVYNTDTEEAVGEFCADAGLVSVFLLDEVLKYNPDFDYHKERDWTTTLIPDFKGTVQFVVERHEGVYEEDTKWWKAGDKWEDYSVHVVGHGINKKTGEPINFRSTQSSM